MPTKVIIEQIVRFVNILYRNLWEFPVLYTKYGHRKTWMEKVSKIQISC